MFSMAPSDSRQVRAFRQQNNTRGVMIEKNSFYDAEISELLESTIRTKESLIKMKSPFSKR